MVSPPQIPLISQLVNPAFVASHHPQGTVRVINAELKIRAAAGLEAILEEKAIISSPEITIQW